MSACAGHPQAAATAAAQAAAGPSWLMHANGAWTAPPPGAGCDRPGRRNRRPRARSAGRRRGGSRGVVGAPVPGGEIPVQVDPARRVLLIGQQPIGVQCRYHPQAALPRAPAVLRRSPAGPAPPPPRPVRCRECRPSAAAAAPSRFRTRPAARAATIARPSLDRPIAAQPRASTRASSSLPSAVDSVVIGTGVYDHGAWPRRRRGDPGQRQGPGPRAGRSQRTRARAVPL